MDPLEAARAVVLRHVPGASAAFLGGSVLTTHRTTTSDLDIVALLPSPHEPYRASFHEENWPVELFVHTEESWHRFVDREVRNRRSPLLHMCGHGSLLFDHNEVGARIATEAKRLLAAGPPAPTLGELRDRRYALTDLLHDLDGCRDVDERMCIVTELSRRVGELALLSKGSWLGGGKWLARRLHTEVAGTAELLTTAVQEALAGRPGALVTVADDVLAQVGGRLWSGYRQSGE